MIWTPSSIFSSEENAKAELDSAVQVYNFVET